VRRSQALRRVVFGSREGIGDTVYGTIVVMAALTAGSRESGRLWQLVGIVAATVLVLWIAHVYSDTLNESIALGRRLDAAEFRSVARRELAIPLAAAAPVAALCLGAIGVFRESTAVWTALALGLATLAVQGLRYARLEATTPRQTIVTVALNLTLGLLIVGLKAGLAH
jgi:DMSO reductase anchor subunit